MEVDNKRHHRYSGGGATLNIVIIKIGGYILNFINTVISFLILFVFSSKIIYSQNESDTTENYESQLEAYPYVYYTPETELAFGAGGVYTFYTKKELELNPSSISLSGFYSTVQTYEFNFNSSTYFLQNKIASILKLNFAHTYDRFYGIGNDTPDLGTEQYILDNYGGILDFQIPPSLVIATRAGFIFEYRIYDVVDPLDNQYLNNAPPEVFDVAAISGLGLALVWDNRDNIFFPNDGGFTQARSIFYTKDLGSDFTYSFFEVDIRRYWSFGLDHVLAIQIYFQSTSGQPPFYKYPALGGSNIMRGYFKGRYRDKNYLAVQFEYRQYFWWRFGFAVFGSSGEVADEITSFSLPNLKHTFGFGLRFLFNEEEKINLRMDIAFGKNTNGIYFGMEEAF